MIMGVIKEPFDPGTNEMTKTDSIVDKFIWKDVDVRGKLNHLFIDQQQAFFKILLLSNEIGKDLHIVDTTFATDPETNEVEMLINQYQITSQDVRGFRIQEVWSFDLVRCEILGRILAIALFYYEETSIGEEFLVKKPLFWLDCKEC